VPWAERGRRYIPPGAAGSFKEEDLTVRNDQGAIKLTFPGPADDRGVLLSFGGDKDGANSIFGDVSKRVLEIYRREGLFFLHEIRVSESATDRLLTGLYQLFWNNASAREDAPSDELQLLMTSFATPRRQRDSRQWASDRARLMAEYEFEYGSLHRPYLSTYRGAKRRTEILHPLFVRRDAGSVLRIGQLTDTHVDVRADVYEENLKRDVHTLGLSQAPVFNNWNNAFLAAYRHAVADSDVILITGDLIDYGRGHYGVERRAELADNRLYHADRNWFLFMYLLASGDTYGQPTYTILGNHDWRLNPYTPFAIAGAPAPDTMIHNAGSFSDKQRSQILTVAHGPGYLKMISYEDDIENRAVVDRKWWMGLVEKGELFAKKPFTSLWQIVSKAIFGAGKTLDTPGLPTHTTVESVEWYLLTINPFLDYRFKHPGGQDFLMIDWAEDENVVFGDIFQGKRFSSLSGDEGPTARNCLSNLQWHLVKLFAEGPGPGKVIGIHAPPVSPWDDWPDDELRSGWRAFDQGSKGYPYYRAKTPDGQTIQGHPLFATRPVKGVVPDAVYGMDASYNSFERNRADFIKLVGKPGSGVRLVLSGHIHRALMLAVYPAPEVLGPAVSGELLIKRVFDHEARGVKPPAASLATVRKSASETIVPHGALYVIGTSVGPRGHKVPTRRPDKSVLHAYIDSGYTHLALGRDGTIQHVEFRWLPAGSPAPASLPASAGSAAPAVPAGAHP
jgi:predicted MPP superfamily phosphohydrolase